MIAQNQQKVKKEIIRIVQRTGKELTVPEKKFVLEMMTGPILLDMFSMKETGSSARPTRRWR